MQLRNLYFIRQPYSRPSHHFIIPGKGGVSGISRVPDTMVSGLCVPAHSKLLTHVSRECYYHACSDKETEAQTGGQLHEEPMTSQVSGHKVWLFHLSGWRGTLQRRWIWTEADSELTVTPRLRWVWLNNPEPVKETDKIVHLLLQLVLWK